MEKDEIVTNIYISYYLKGNPVSYNFILIVSISILASCANLRHATNINVMKVKSYKNNPEKAEKLDKDVRTISSKEANKCKLLAKHTALDNVFDSGKKFSVIYLKQEAKRVGGNAVEITKIEKSGDYGFKAHGKIFKCTED